MCTSSMPYVKQCILTSSVVNLTLRQYEEYRQNRTLEIYIIEKYLNECLPLQ